MRNVSRTLTNNVGVASTYTTRIFPGRVATATQRQNIPITRPCLYAPKCLSVYNSVVIRGASQMSGIICIVIPFARPAGFVLRGVTRRHAANAHLIILVAHS